MKSEIKSKTAPASPHRDRRYHRRTGRVAVRPARSARRNLREVPRHGAAHRRDRRPQIVVDIRSTGGDVNDALLIHDALCSLDAHITTRCYGYTASAATIIAQAASPGCREISANALYLIHTAICAAEGNAAEIAGKSSTCSARPTRASPRSMPPFRPPGRGVRGADGRKQRQRPLAIARKRPSQQGSPTR